MFARRESTFVAWMFIGLLLFLTAGCGSGDGQTEAPSTALSASGGETGTAGATPSTTPASGTAITPTEPRQVPQEDLYPEVVFKTSEGVIKVRLNRDKARATVDNFLQNYVDREYYDNTIFHYVDKDFMVLGGAFSPDLEAKAKRAEIYSEAHNGLKNHRGTIAMARDPAFAHSATNQFFFNLVDNPKLDHIGRENSEEYGYCVFGEIVEGAKVLDKIAEVEVEDRDGFVALPVRTVLIESVRRLR
jgi:peptidyl-prolyl cis-trans isomerase A (cyclophilin A)